ncbi:DUF2510 domain-containing protein [Demequina pelophila]|uniref:DUF2510 domain-containing protein n=1 Tax=Demequina pelophila TaxID=1638984 RepID=UPI0007812E8F|nr:DUF2510 domain-containing protein [Demequina pelophila]
MSGSSWDAAASPPGWLPDPTAPHLERYWDGRRWTGQTRRTYGTARPDAAPASDLFARASDGLGSAHGSAPTAGPSSAYSSPPPYGPPQPYGPGPSYGSGSPSGTSGSSMAGGEPPSLLGDPPDYLSGPAAGMPAPPPRLTPQRRRPGTLGVIVIATIAVTAVLTLTQWWGDLASDDANAPAAAEQPVEQPVEQPAGQPVEQPAGQPGEQQAGNAEPAPGDGGATGDVSGPATRPETPSVAYPVFGSTELVEYLAAHMIAHTDAIDVSHWASSGDADRAITAAMHEALTQNPYVFVQRWNTRTVTSGAGVEVTISPEYTYDPDEQRRRQATTAGGARQIADMVRGYAPATDAEAADIIHELIRINATYDYAAAEAIDRGESGPHVAQSQEAYGILAERTAVCNGYAQAFHAIAFDYGLESVMVTGDAWDNGSGGAHAWNRVLVDGTWKFVDVTWDDSGDYESKEFLLLPTEPASHRPDSDWMVDTSLAGG